jgi:8-oxo-dGTP pyrophosphatase MutT (NUDIX family)
MRRISAEVVYENAWMTVHEDVVERADGSRGIYGVVEKADFAVVVPRGEGGFWMVEQFRYPIQRRSWEFPMGTWPHGVTGDQVALAQAELAEETGLKADRLDHLGSLFEGIGYANQRCDVFLATGLTEGPTAREVTELDMVHRFVGDGELTEMIAGGLVVDAVTVAALSLFLLRADLRPGGVV